MTPYGFNQFNPHVPKIKTPPSLSALYCQGVIIFLFEAKQDVAVTMATTTCIVGWFWFPLSSPKSGRPKFICISLFSFLSFLRQKLSATCHSLLVKKGSKVKTTNWSLRIPRDSPNKRNWKWVSRPRSFSFFQLFFLSPCDGNSSSVLPLSSSSLCLWFYFHPINKSSHLLTPPPPTDKCHFRPHS